MHYAPGTVMLAAVMAVCLLLLLTPFAEARFASVKVSLALTVGEDSHQLSEDMIRICAQQTDMSMEELRKFRRHDFDNSSEATQCFTHCLYEQMGLMRDGVFIQRDTVAEVADLSDPNAVLRKERKECCGIKSANQCEMAFKIHECRHRLRMRGVPVPTPAMEDNEIAADDDSGVEQDVAE